MVTLEEFKKLQIKIAVIKDVQEHPHAERLYVLTIDLGDTDKQIVAGIRNAYAKEELIGRRIVVVDNLQPVMLRGVESQGMLLAASDDKVISLLSPDKEVRPGSVVK